MVDHIRSITTKTPPIQLTVAVQRQRRSVTRRRLRAGAAERPRVRLRTVARSARRQSGAARRVRRLARRVTAGGGGRNAGGAGAANHAADAAALVVAERVGRRGGQRRSRRTRHGDRSLRSFTDLTKTEYPQLVCQSTNNRLCEGDSAKVGYRTEADFPVSVFVFAVCVYVVCV